jgi:UDP:flavonoid glycosyltransferase YjiC (YdhE family)
VSRILIAWELGGNLGHITPLLVVARALRERGHHVSFAVPSGRPPIVDALKRASFPFVQAPTPRSTQPDLPQEPASYPEILLHFGFADPSALATSVRAWREIYRHSAPNLIVFDHAPTALLAARATGLPRVLFGTGFASPPRVSPMPSIRPWQEISTERLLASEQRALDTTNAALRAIGAIPLNVLHELFDVEENLLTTLPELDHYGTRPNAHYICPIFGNIDGNEPQWPEGEGKKVFVYIRPNSAAFRPLAATLRKLDVRTLWFAPGIPADARANFEASSSLNIVTEAVDIRAVTASADAAVLHGGHGTTAAMLLAGVPVLLLPEQLEQMLLGRCVAALGAGAALNLRSSELGPTTMLRQLVHDSRFVAHARAFAAKHSRLDQARQQDDLIAPLEALLSRKVAMALVE